MKAEVSVEPGHIEGILPKGPYLPCVSMAVGPFWQDTIDMGAVCGAGYVLCDMVVAMCCGER